MNNELVNTFTPTNDHGRLDIRFEEDLRIIFNGLRPEVIDGLNEFKQKTTDLENQYGCLAYELCMAFFKRMEDIDRKEKDQPSNQFRWRSKKLRNQLIEGLKERGFKPSNTSKIIGAAEYVSQLETCSNKKLLNFVKSQSIASQYLLSGMNYEGIEKAMTYEIDTKSWDKKTDTFIGKALTKKVIEDLKREYPKNPEETRGRKKLEPSSNLHILDDDPSTFTEVLGERSKEDMTQLELIDELVQIVCLVDTSKIYKDKDVIERLSIVSSDLWKVAHLSKLPIPTS